MKRDLRLLPDRLSVNRLNYIEEVSQTLVPDDLSVATMKFEHCLDQVEGELSYKNAQAEYYKEYLMDLKKKNQGNLLRYLRDVIHLYEGSHLSKQAINWNLELLEKNQRVWFYWVENISYPGIQWYCLFYAPSLECLIDFMTYIGTGNNGQSFEEKDEEQQQVLVMLLIYVFIEHMITIKGNMEWDNRMNRSSEFWDIARWENEEMGDYIKKFIHAMLYIPQDIMEPILFDILSDEWIFDTKTLRNKYRKIFRDAFLELIAEHYKENIAAIIQANSWESSKSALYHRLALYCYWERAYEAGISETGEKLREVLWGEWKNVICSDIYLVNMLYNSDDGFWLLWLSGKLMSDEENMRQRLSELLSDIDMRLDGWKKEYEKSRHTSDVIFCIFTVAAMAGEWKSKQKNGTEKAEKFYWYIFEKANKFARGNQFLDEVAKKSLLQIWSRMVLLSRKNPLISRKKIIWDNFRSIDNYEYRVHILDVLIDNINRKGLNWVWDKQLKQKVISVLIEEKTILDKERLADGSYYEKYYRREGEALERCLSFLGGETHASQ